jgi:hypothetical protein
MLATDVELITNVSHGPEVSLPSFSNAVSSNTSSLHSKTPGFRKHLHGTSLGHSEEHVLMKLKQIVKYAKKRIKF